MGELNGRTALVTGAARGLGAAIARAFVREGARVLISDVLEDDGVKLAAELGEAADFSTHDVTDPVAWTRAVEQAQVRFGGLDILVNNAGVMGVYPFEDTTPSLWERQIGIMQTGPFLGMKAVIPGMLRQGGGSIVNVASTNAIRGMAATAAYSAAKHGLLGLSRALALEYAAAGVRINVVCPGAMRTPMLSASFGEQMEQFAQHVPIGRLADPAEVAEAVAFLASPRASFCVGATLVVDGGMTVK
jgi:3alpha(or 20beta)-hydroxysteroid dehydrogenase